MTEAQLQAVIDSTYAQIVEIQRLKAVVALAFSNLTDIHSDVGSVSSSGKDGSESYTRETLTNKIKQFTEMEDILTKTLAEQVALKVRMFPYTYVTKVV